MAFCWAVEPSAVRSPAPVQSPPPPVLVELPPDEAKSIPQVPGSLDAVLDNLEADHAYLTEGHVFTEDLIAAWIDYKRENEVDPVRLRPHPYEFDLYYNV